MNGKSKPRGTKKWGRWGGAAKPVRGRTEAMSTLVYEVLYVRDLAPVDCVPFGREQNGQRFQVQSVPILRRIYAMRIRGATTAGPKVLDMIAADGTTFTSDPFAVPPDKANNFTLNMPEFIAPAFGEFTLRLRDVPELVQPATAPGAPLAIANPTSDVSGGTSEGAAASPDEAVPPTQPAAAPTDTPA